MQISENKVVKLTYELYIHEESDDFEIVEVAGEDDPLVFLYGNSGLPQDFETQLNGLKADDTFNFVLEPQEGFGDFSEEDIAEFPISMFQIEDGQIPEGLLEPGSFVPFTNEDGSQLMGRIHAVEGEVVLVDFNHPLAGKTLKFEGKIISVREATADEISHGHVHGDGGVHH
ncbi:peptidylprolyl isomerase [Emticicia sp. CRIBPO]|uniref:FKBP-type peptidyl-prolyl cis-trans isomerase n=1 Tax=Emticicia sp. CRIBPO TaxID=2683258 RepID=UPI001413454A|nr:FKBP-type peptidyl-prolyl cis-trans isomerase [Emticicia sp. CRIBPO]NBA85172.1 peptidylprolyl isomerase [Emticicia sp. CRIBPO]